MDNFGPIIIPKKGVPFKINVDNLALYHRLITVYEHQTLEVKENGIYINGVKATEFTPTYNYYWMMGDNRHFSQDSRVWGFVPETHIVGRASLIWFSYKNGIRWNRMFSFIK